MTARSTLARGRLGGRDGGRGGRDGGRGGRDRGRDSGRGGRDRGRDSGRGGRDGGRRGRGGGVGGRGGIEGGRGGRLGGIGSSSSSGHCNEEDDYENSNAHCNVGLDAVEIRSHGESSHVVQGSNAPELLHAHASDRPLIWIKGGQFNNKSVIGRKIVENLKNMFGGAWPTWSKVPEEFRDRLFERFRGLYRWDMSIEYCIRDLWNEHMTNRYSCVMRGARDRAIVDAIADGLEVENDLSVIIPYNPRWMKQEYWVELVQKHWNTEDWKAKSEIARANHAQMIGGHHTCGSVSYDTTRKRLEKSLSRPLVDCELFTHSHLKKGTRPGEGMPPVFVDERSRLQVEAYKRRMIEKHGEDIDEYSYDESIWEECAGGRKKGRLYGSDKHPDTTFLFTGNPGPSSSGSCIQGATNEEVQRLSQLVEDMQEREEREKREREEREKEKEEREKGREELARKEMDEYKAKMDEKLAHFFARYSNPDPSISDH